MKKKKSVGNRYIRRLSRAIPKKYPWRQQLLEQLQDDVEMFLEENPDAGIKEVEQKFGTPVTILSAMQGIAGKKILTGYYIRRAVAAVTVGIAAVLITLYMSVAIYSLYQTYEYTHGTITVTVTEEVNEPAE